MMRSIAGAFVQHPASVGESYTEHFGVAAGFSLALFKAASAAMIHALFPFLCEHTASDAIKELHGRMASRRNPH